MSHATRWCLRLALLVLAGAVPPVVAAAQEVEWRTDYKKAREESAAKGVPLVIDFGSENCFWCKQLESRTLRDPAVLALLNEQCIPLKIDATKQVALAEALRVQSYPTIVFASPDGRILGVQEGFVEAPKLKELLTRAVASASTPEWMNHDYKTAAQQVQDGEYVKALGLLRNILEDGKDRPIQAKARTLIADVEQQATVKLQRAKQLAEHGQKAEALKGAKELAKVFEGTLAAREGSALATTLTAKTVVNDPQRVQRSRELLAQAKEEFRRQAYASCLEYCESIVAVYGDLPQASEATQLLTELKESPELMKAASEQLSERLTALYLNLAEGYLKKGQPQTAIYYLERIVQLFPNSKQAETAQSKLTVLQGFPTRTENKQP